MSKVDGKNTFCIKTYCWRRPAGTVHQERFSILNPVLLQLLVPMKEGLFMEIFFAGAVIIRLLPGVFAKGGCGAEEAEFVS